MSRPECKGVHCTLELRNSWTPSKASENSKVETNEDNSEEHGKSGIPTIQKQQQQKKKISSSCQQLHECDA